MTFTPIAVIPSLKLPITVDPTGMVDLTLDESQALSWQISIYEYIKMVQTLQRG